MKEELIYGYGYSDLSVRNAEYDKNAPLQEMVNNAVSGVVDNAPEEMDTLSEVAAKIDDIETNKVDREEAGNIADEKVNTAIENLVGSAPEDLDTIKEIAAVLTDSETGLGALNDALASKANVDDVYTKQDADETFVKKDELPEMPDTSAFVTMDDVNTALEPYAKTEDLDAYAKTEDLEAYAKTEQLDAYAKAEDLDAYAKTEQLDAYAKTDDLPNMDEYLKVAAAEETYQPKGEYLTEVPSEYVTETELDEKGYLTEHQDLSEYAKTEYVDTKISQLVGDAPEALDTLKEISDALNDNTDAVAGIVSTLSEKASTSYVDEKDGALGDRISALENIDHDAFAKTADLPDMGEYLKVAAAEETYQPKGEYLTEVPSEYVTETELDEKGYLTEHQDLSEYVTESELAEKGYLTEHQDLSEYAKTAYVDEKDGALGDRISALENIDHDAFAKTTDLPDMENYVTTDKYDELNGKYAALLEAVHSVVTGDAATSINADYVESTLSDTNTSVTITEGELGDVTIPETTKSMSVTAPIQDNATVTLSSPKSFTLNNTSEEPVSVTVESPAPATESGSVTSVKMSGDFNTITLHNASLSAVSNTTLTANSVVVDNEDGLTKNNTISGVTFADGSVIASDTSANLGIANANTEENGNVPSATINAPNSTVTLNKGQWNELTSNVGADTLIVTQNAHINKLVVEKGNVIVNDIAVENRIGEVSNNTDYTVSCKETHVSDGPSLNSALLSPGITVMDEDITRARIVYGIIASGNSKLDMNGRTLTIDDANSGIMTRGSVNLTIDGNGTFKSTRSYGLWADGNSTINIMNGTFEGNTHTLYLGSSKATINVYGGVFKLNNGQDNPADVDVNGNFKFLVNYLDKTWDPTDKRIHIYGGKFYGFNPMVSYGEPNGPVNLLEDGYTVNESVEDGVKVYEVVKA